MRLVSQGTFGSFGGVVAVPYENIGSISNRGC
jgi:hypothetical protein